MNKDSLLISSLDTITGNQQILSLRLNDVNKRLGDIEDKIILDDWFKILLVIVPILAAIISFLLTKKKDVRFKKAEIGGEIFMRIHELKKLRAEYFHSFINSCAFHAARRLESDQKRDDEFLRNTYGIIDDDEPELIQRSIDDIAKDLAKYVGQFRYYMRPKDSRKLKNMSLVVTLHHVKYEFFDGCDTQQDIFDKHEKMILSKVLDDVKENQFTELFNKLEELLIK